MLDLIGRTLGHYRIVDKIGEGGMGEVYRSSSLHSTKAGSQFVEYNRNQEVPMNKTEMTMKLAKRVGISQGKAAEIIDTMFSAHPGKGLIATALDAGEKVTIPGFGTFTPKHRSARRGRNPATGATIFIPAKKYAHFKPGKTLRERVER